MSSELVRDRRRDYDNEYEYEQRHQHLSIMDKWGKRQSQWKCSMCGLYNVPIYFRCESENIKDMKVYCTGCITEWRQRYGTR